MRGLYAIIDPEACRLPPLAVAQAVLRGGCAALQLRAKQLSDADFLALGHSLGRVCRAAGVPFFVNDRVWLARELGADGVHVGQDDQALEQVREALGPQALIGLSTHSLAQALDAERRGASLIGFGPVFPTRTKLNPEPQVGLPGLREVCSVLRIPVVAIGGVDPRNAADVAAAGAPLGAAISALCAAEDPEQAARTLHRVLQAAPHARQS
ncbi:MAG TPA: thiamine phosphate synthase [Polyangiales bacterium]|nr:thiamine phosphate synthase [Polyangiales bacterium]